MKKTCIAFISILTFGCTAQKEISNNLSKLSIDSQINEISERRLRETLEVIASDALSAHSAGHFNGHDKAAGLAFNRLTRILADANDPRTIQAWQAIPAGEHERATIEQLIAYAQRIHAWQQLTGWLGEHLGAEDLNSGEIQYWLGKAHEKTGNSAAANSHYRKAAATRDFYGFLAAEKLGLPYAMNDRPVVKDPVLYGKVMSRAAAYRIKIFHHIGLTSRASQEWPYLVKGLNDDEIAQAALFVCERANERLEWRLSAARAPLPA